jgi:hypothetical protein
MINIEFWHKLTEIEKGIILINYRLNIELENSKWGQILNKYSHLKPSQVYKTIFNNVFKFSDFDEQSILENLENLKRIYLNNSPIQNFTFLGNFTHIERISAANINIFSLNGLEKIDQLRWLDISNTQIQDLSLLKMNKNLERLIFCNCKIEDLSVVKGLTNLYELNFDGTQVGSLKHLENHQKLGLISAEGIELIDLQVLSTLKNLKFLHIQNCKNSSLEIDTFRKLKKGGYLSI